jgi:hypothetical protein
MDEAMPHGPNEPCTCDGLAIDGSPCGAMLEGQQCGAAGGHLLGCPCDIDWETAHHLSLERPEGA